jgi:hypothetical protein
MDSNSQYAGAVNWLSALLSGLCFAIGCGSGRGASGTVRYQRRGWAMLAAGLGAARRTARLMKAASPGWSQRDLHPLVRHSVKLKSPSVCNTQY